MKKKKIVILVVISVLVLCVIGFGVNKIFFQDNSEIVESKEEKKSKDNDTKKKNQENANIRKGENLWQDIQDQVTKDQDVLVCL